MGHPHSGEMTLRLLSAIPFTFVLSISTVAQADGFNFKGLAFGSSVATVKEMRPAYLCRATLDSVTGDKICGLTPEKKCMNEPGNYPDNRSCREAVRKEMTFAGVPANISLFFYEDKFGLASALFASSDFARITAALREKYGKPSSVKTEPVTNRMGATFENQVLEWKKSGTAIRAEKYTSSLDDSTVRIFSDSYDAEFKKRLDAERAKGAKDL